MDEAERARRSRNTCKRKRRFTSREWALVFARAKMSEAEQRGDDLSTYHVKPYLCPSCKQWHLTRDWRSLKDDGAVSLVSCIRLLRRLT